MTLDQILDSPQTLRRFSLSPVVLRLMVEAAKPEPDFQVLAEIIRTDPALAATVLSLVNSPFYGQAQKVSDIQRAAVVLGGRELFKTALLVSLRQDQEKGLREQGIDPAPEWRLTLWSAVAAEALADRLCPEQADLAYLCALLKDVSLLFLKAVSPDLLPRREGSAPLLALAPGQLQSENDAWGLDHPDLSRLLLAKWGLPPEIGEGLAAHHDLERLEECTPLQQSVILATHWADVELSPARGPFSAVRFNHRLRAVLGLRESELEKLRSDCLVRFEALTQHLGLGQAPADECCIRHSLKAMQEAYFMSIDLLAVDGGVEAVAGLVARHLGLSFGLRHFDLALRSSHGGGHFLFSSTAKDGLSPAQGPMPSADLPWTIRGKGLPLRAGDRKWGELRFRSQDLRPTDSGPLALYLRFAAQAYENYCQRHSVMEERASAFDALPLAVARLDERGRVVETNKRFRSLIKLSPDQVRSKDLEKLLNERVGLILGQEWRAFLDDPERDAVSRIVCFLDARAGNGEREHCAYLSARREHGEEQGRILFLLENMRELSRMEVQTLRRRDFLERLIGAMRDLVFTVDAAGVIGFSSLPGEEGRGESLFARFTPEDTYSGPWGPELLEQAGSTVVEVSRVDAGVRKPYELVFSRLETDGGPETLVVARDLSTVRRLEKELKLRAIYDGLTGLFNHAQFRAVLERELSRSRRTGRSMGLIFFDLDGFKAINDSKGHQAGDAILRLVGEILGRELRQGMDFPCRYGGDEFAVVVTETGEKELELIGERLRQAIAAQFSGKVTISAGLTALNTEDNADSILNRVDRAAYSAKSAGGNTVVWAK